MLTAMTARPCLTRYAVLSFFHAQDMIRDAILFFFHAQDMTCYAVLLFFHAKDMTRATEADQKQKQKSKTVLGDEL